MRSLFIVLAILLGPATALAETSPADAGCPYSVPSLSSSLPANVPGIPFGGTGLYVSDVKLADDDGTVIPTHLDTSAADVVLVLESALVVGKKYTLTWSDGCASDRAVSFVASAAITLPKTLGTLSAGPQKQRYDGCPMGEPRWLEQKEITLTLDPALSALTAVMKIDFHVDDAATGYGAFGAVDRAVLASISCPGRADKRRVTATAQLAGGPTLEATPLDVELACGRAPFVCPKDYPADAGSGATSEGDDVITSQGCQTGRGGGAFLAVPAFAMLAALLRRKR